MTATLTGVGVGPGDPELVTVKGVRVLCEADLVVVPVLDDGQVGRAEASVLAHTDAARVRRIEFVLGAGRGEAWQHAAGTVRELFDAGVDHIAFATIGDPNVYSTFTYLAREIRELRPDIAVETVPGVTAMQDLAARGNIVLCEADESLALLPLTAGLDAFEEALTHFDTVVGYKGGRSMPAVLDIVRRNGRLGTAVYGSGLGLASEDVRPAVELSEQRTPYLSTIIVKRAGTPAEPGGQE